MSEGAVAAWEYASIVVPGLDRQALTETLNNAGVRGWELVSLTSTDPVLTVGSVVVAIVKRPIVPFDDPQDRSVGWKPDPSERHQYRYWDGECWTFGVSDGDVEARDPPTRLTPAERPQ